MTIIYAWIAQSVERVTVNHKVNGSIPFPGVIFQQLLKNKIITIEFIGNTSYFTTRYNTVPSFLVMRIYSPRLNV